MTASEKLSLVYRFVIFVALAPALGAMLFALIHRLTGGKWGGPLEPFLLAASRLAPWLWFLVLPVVFLGDRESAPWPAYDSHGMLLLRSVAYGLVFFVIAVRLGKPRAQTRALGPAGFIVLVFTLHFLADDWLVSLEPRAHSTAFPLVWMTGLAVAGLAVTVLRALATAPSAGEQAANHGIDWGNLLLTAMVFWCYVAFAQFLIIWAGNLPREIAWYLPRTQGAWVAVPPILAVIHFLLPFAILLSRDAKRSPRLLGGVAVTLLAGQLLYTAWLILPALSRPELTAHS